MTSCINKRTPTLIVDTHLAIQEQGACFSKSSLCGGTSYSPDNGDVVGVGQCASLCHLLSELQKTEEVIITEHRMILQNLIIKQPLP